MCMRHGGMLAVCLAAITASSAPTQQAPRRDRSGAPLPPGALARLGTTRFRVGDAGGCLAISPDGSLLASAGGSTVRFWDRASGKERRCVQLPVLSVFHVAFSPDGKYFVALGDHMSMISRPIADVIDNSVFVGEVAGGKVHHHLRGRYTSAVFSADGKSLFTRDGNAIGGDAEHPLLRWEVASGKKVWQSAAVVSYALSPDGNVLAGGDMKGVIRLWDVKSGTERGQLKGHGSPIQALGFSPDSQTLVSASGDRRGVGLGGDQKPETRDHGIRIWDIASGKERRRIRQQHANFHWLRFALDGKTFASLVDGDDLFLWDAKTGRLRQRFPRQTAGGYSALFSPDSKHLIYLGTSDAPEEEQELVQWDIAAGKETRRWRTSERWLRGFLFTPDGKALYGLGDSIRVWDTTTGKERIVDNDHRAAIRTMTFSRDGKFLATVDERSCLRMWDAVRGVPLPSLAGERVARCAFTPDGRLLVTIASDATVQVHEVSTGRSIRDFRVGSTGTDSRWRLSTNPISDEMDSWIHPSDRCVLDPACRVLAVVHEDQCIHLWDVRRGEELRRLEGHRGGIHDLVFSPDGKWLFTRGEDRTVRWWNVGEGVEIQRFQEDGVNPLYFSLSGNGRLLAWAAGERIHLYDLAARKEVRQWKGHAGATLGVLLGRGGAMLASAGEDRIIHCWDTQTGRELRAIAMKEDQCALEFLTSTGGRLLSYYSMDGKNSEYALRDVMTGREVCRTRTYEGEHFALAPDGNTAVLNRAKWVQSEKADKNQKRPYESPYPTPIRASDELSFVELASGGVIAEVSSGHRGGVRCLAFSPDGKTLATGGADTTVLLWDWRQLVGLSREDGPASTDREIESAWTDLAAPDARKAYRAIGTLTVSGDRAVSLLRERLRPAADADRQRWRQWIAELDDSNFNVREKATRELSQLGIEAELFLRRSAAARVPLETRRRLEQALASEAMKRASGESLRRIRATQVLEAIATPAARELLESWSHGDGDAWLTQEAQTALRRLQTRIAP